jgi:ubiquinone/menaquinone biosynthesis C-methylase UbiE
MKDKTAKAYIEEQYKDDSNLNKRLQIHAYSENKKGLYSWIAEKLEMKEGMKILELGCGNGEIWKHIVEQKGKTRFHATLSDISEGMIGKARENLKGLEGPEFAFEVFDYHKIPFEPLSFDLVIANHSLYHAADINGALAEIHRVLKPSGKLYATTIGKGHMRELNDLIKIYRLPVQFNPDKVADNFGLENGYTLLQEHFKNVELVFYKDRLIVPKTGPVITYIESIEEVNYSKGSNHRRMERLKNELERRIELDKAMYISKNYGLYVAGN